ncbi:MAG: hypothetical protein OHK0039_47080 [Bacteroidia bacterium]
MSFLRHGFLPALLLLSSLAAHGQTQRVRITGQLTDCAQDTLYFFDLDGTSLRALAAIPLTRQEGQSVFDVSIDGVPKGFFLVGGGTQANTRLLIMGSEPQLSLRGTCPALGQAEVLGSPENTAYEAALQASGQYVKDHRNLINQYRVVQRNPQTLLTWQEQMQHLDAAKLALYDSLRRYYPFVAKAIALRTYLSFQGSSGGATDEAVFFAKNYFRYADFSDPDYHRIPLVQEAFQNYASNLAQVGLAHEAQVGYAIGHIDRMEAPSRAHKTALLGLIAGFEGQNEDAYALFAESYLDSYAGENPPLDAQLNTKLAAIRDLLIGALAPEIRLPTPAGDTLSSRDLRGKVLLLDFWASWCGPCRKENPRVRAMYERYKAQGFEILGVSLDRDRNAWVQAIAQDQLGWYHVSDLKFWSSVAARTYGVRAIPYTVLLDAEGRIVAKNLRGAELEARVAQLLGNR